MTAIVGIRCTDGIVVGADSSATFGDGQYLRTIEQEFKNKILVIDGAIIIAGTGYVGHAQRFQACVNDLWDKKSLSGTGLDIAKAIAQASVNDFSKTIPIPHLKSIDFSAIVAYPAKDGPQLCEFPGQIGFQPELKDVDGLWFTSAGSGQPLTDSFLALFKSIFWKGGPPNLAGGKFTALWALKHACDVNPGGIKEPIRMAVMEGHKGKYKARFLSDDELKEQTDIVQAASEYFGEFQNLLTGEAEAKPVPQA